MASLSDVQLIAVTKRFGQIVAVASIDAKIAPATYCCLLGPSGCGKTTTLRMIAGHELPTSGEIAIGGVRVTDLPPARRRTAMMFQNYALFPHLSCTDNVAFSLRMRGVGKAEQRERALAMLRLVEMDALAGRLPAQLSGGQQQRVALRRDPALVADDVADGFVSAEAARRDYVVVLNGMTVDKAATARQRGVMAAARGK